MLELKSWETARYSEGTICFEVKRLNRKSALVHQRTLALALRAEVDKLQASKIDPGDETKSGESDGEAIVRSLHARATMEVAALDFYEAIGDEYIRKCFTDYTRNWSGVQLDGAPVTDGSAVAEYADNALVRFVLTEINRASRLSVTEGNASASPSGSAPEAGTTTADSVLTASGTDSAAGTVA